MRWFTTSKGKNTIYGVCFLLVLVSDLVLESFLYIIHENSNMRKFAYFSVIWRSVALSVNLILNN